MQEQLCCWYSAAAQQSQASAWSGKANVPAVLLKLNSLLDGFSTGSERAGLGDLSDFETELHLLEKLFTFSYITYC